MFDNIRISAKCLITQNVNLDGIIQRDDVTDAKSGRGGMRTRIQPARMLR